MPRQKRGGERQGTPGTKYPNRTDLSTPKPLAPTATPGQQYGAKTAQLNAQKIIPMASGPLGLGNPSGPTPQGQPSSAPAGGPMPGSLGDLTDGSQRPDEHLMTGVNAGPGPGSEALAPMLPDSPAASALALLNSLEVVSPAVASVRNQLALQAQNQMPH